MSDIQSKIEEEISKTVGLLKLQITDIVNSFEQLIFITPWPDDLQPFTVFKNLNDQ